MILHRLTSVTTGVPIPKTAASYRHLGLTPNEGPSFQTLGGSEQLRLVQAQRRMLLEARIGAWDNFTEHCSDMDCIVNDQLWKPEVFERGPKRLFSWAPSPSFTMAKDLSARMGETYSSR
ncbi:MAG: hypothetical protein ACR2IK_10095 [Chloroflexota bacterium]